MARIVAALICSLIAFATPAAALSGVVSWQDRASGEAREHWTAERLAGALPLEMSALDAAQVVVSGADETSTASPTEPAFGHPASPPRLEIKPDEAHQLFVPRRDRTDFAAGKLNGLESAAAPDTGTSQAPFTSSRLVPLAADLSYPYRAVGRLFLQTPDGPFACSAAVVGPRLVLTAAHCVHSGSAVPGFYSQFLFVPAYRDGKAPFGSWTVRTLHVPADWAARGSAPHPADYALLEMRDLQGRRLGDVVGWLGVQTKRLFPNHLLCAAPHKRCYGERPVMRSRRSRFEEVAGSVGGDCA